MLILVDELCYIHGIASGRIVRSRMCSNFVRRDRTLKGWIDFLNCFFEVRALNHVRTFRFVNLAETLPDVAVKNIGHTRGPNFTPCLSLACVS